MRGRATTIALIAAVALLAPAAALGGSITFTDPDDFEIAPDVQVTTKRTFLSGDAVRRVRISVGGDLGPRYRLRVLVDSLGGHHADLVMVATVRRIELVNCFVRYVDGPAIHSNCDAGAQRAWWGVLRRDLEPDKRVHWRIVALGGPGFDDVRDRAPDAGWYA
jgi:hypothetical protein